MGAKKFLWWKCRTEGIKERNPLQELFLARELLPDNEVFLSVLLIYERFSGI